MQSQSQKSIKVSRQQGSPSLYVWFAADWQIVENLTNTLKYQFADVKIHSMYGLYHIIGRRLNHIIYTVNLTKFSNDQKWLVTHYWQMVGGSGSLITAD